MATHPEVCKTSYYTRPIWFYGMQIMFSNLIETIDSIIDMFDAGYPVDIFYFSFCKTFDSVPHYRLLNKLKNFGISDKMLDIVRDFLSGRAL
jgi:hypothetical protein